MREVVVQMADRGLGARGGASYRHEGPVPEDLSQTPFIFEGLVGLFDPVRADVPAALAIARGAGVGVATITGDYPATALEIGRRCGIDVDGGVLTGPEIAALDFAELRERVKRIRVFARVLPEQKLALVEAFKANGEVVAMTGDGVNDAAALEAAHIGIAMGERGTDVAREAADIVLLDESFASIVGGVRLGRRIFANLRKALIYVTAIYVPVAGLALFPIVLGLPPMLFPMHVVLLELVIDPVCSIVFESEPSEKGAMKKPPRPANESLFGVRILMFGLFQGTVVLVGVFGLYVGALASGIPAPESRAAAFVALVAANLVLAFADSAEAGTSFFDRRRLPFWAIGASATTILAVVLFVPAAARMFSVSLPPSSIIGLAFGVALVAGGWYGFLRRAGLVRPTA
jgi:Ca2+-transporting ATPase